jgi:hypothetical protein
MMTVKIYEKATEVPKMACEDFFHSTELMALLEATPRQKPLMAVAFANDASDLGSTPAEKRIVGHMLVSVRYRHSWFPPYIYTHARVLGEGEYVLGSSAAEKNEAFTAILTAVKKRLNNKVLYFEISNLSEKMFGYRTLRKAEFFPVKWMKVHNSLHSRTPEERISPKLLKRINAATARGIYTKPVETEDEFRQFSKLLHHHHWLKPRRFIPADQLFRGMMNGGHAKLFISKYKQRVIGCTVLVYSGKDAFLWYSAAKRKSYAPLHPNAVTYWNTIRDAHADGYEHIRFMDVGLPFRKNPYRDFILKFGGKEVSAYRWFHISIRWINALATWLWRE